MSADKEMIKQLRSSSILDIVNMIRDVSSRKAKIDILKNAMEYRRGFKDFLVAVYDPFTQYYVRQIPDYIPENAPHTDIEHMLMRPEKFLGVLSERRRTGHEAEKFLVYLLESVPKEDAKCIEMIINRTIDAGIQISSINKARPNTVAKYPCMLATAFKDKMIDQIEFPTFVQTKMDGLRANIIVNKLGKTDVRGRSGKSLGLPGYFDGAVRRTGFEYIIDGEIIVYDSKDDKLLPRKKGNGIINKFSKNKATDADRKRYIPRMYAWDYIPMSLFNNFENYETHKDNAPYRTRLKEIPRLITDGNRIQVIETNEVNSFDEIRTIFMDHLANGEEGVIVKAPESLWRNGRPKNHLKMKGVKECELFISGIQEGKGRFKGKLGAFHCESSDGRLKVSVGSGFTEKQREDYFDEGLVGEIVSIQFNEVIEHDTPRGAEKSLFLPIFIEIREDKTTANSQTEICKL